MDSNMSTAAYVHRAGGSSSASSTCTSSLSGAGMATNGTGGGGGGSRMAVIGVTRNVKLRRRGASGFGFSLRGGREYAAGFYVSDVVPGGEAHRNGLRVGDQILRVNGYPVEDAVHQEVALLAKNQQVLVLKIRSVGMIPVKDNPNDPVTWHMVQQQQQQLQFGDAVSNEIRIRILVGEKGRLGCGVCRGIVPGLTVQGTREGGPARAAGLKAGDIILWCNGQSLTDLPFERAIEVMRNSAVLDLVVNRPIVSHVYDSPEALWMRGSTGYDSESSSIAGPSPPPMHLPNPASSPQHRVADPRLFQQSCNRNARNFYPPNSSGPSDWGHVEQSQEWTRKPNNTTVIRISQSQPQQQQFRRLPRQPMRAGQAVYDDANDLDEEPLYDPVAPKDFECHDFDANPREEIDRRAEYRREHGIRDSQFNESSVDGVFVKLQENGQTDGDGGGVGGVGGGNVVLGAQRQAEKERKTVTTVEVHQPCPPTPPSMPPPVPYKWPAETKPMNAMGMQMGSTMSMGSTGSTETESSLESSCGGKDTASTSSSLSTSSCEPASSVSFASSIAAAAACGGGGPKVQERPAANRPSNSGPAKIPPPPPPSIDLSTAITQELQRRAKQRSMNNAAAQEQGEKPGGVQELRKPQNPEALRAQEQKVTHDKLMEEFKRAHQRMFSNAQQRNQSTEQNSEQTEAKRLSPPSLGLSAGNVKAAKRSSNDDAVEMQSIESFKLKETPSVRVPKPPSTYFPSSSPGKLGNDSAKQNGGPKPRPSATCVNQSAGKAVSKVAIRIGTYETDAKQPSRLGFLSQGAEGKSSSEGSPVASRLQNELVATLQRSNLRKNIEGENDIPNPPGEVVKATQENGQVDAAAQSNVEKLATNLNKVTIRVNPEASNR